MASCVFIIADHVPYVPSAAVFTTQGIVQNVIKEESREYALVIEESRIYSMNIEAAVKGFVTALCIVNESGETYFQTNSEGFLHSVMSFGLDEGTYTLSIHFLTDYEAVAAFFEDTGFGELNPRDIKWINEAFSRDITDYSVEYSITIR